MILPASLRGAQSVLQEFAPAADIIAAVAVLASAAKGLSAWRARRIERDTLLDRPGAERYSLDDFVLARTNYIRPDSQMTDPGDGVDGGAHTERKALFAVIDAFARDGSPYRHCILLGESGSGKTSFLLNYYAHHRRSSRRSAYSVAVHRLNVPGVDESIRMLPNKGRTVLLLDALDEDLAAVDDPAARLREIVESSAEFRRVLITCRSHFFRTDDEIPSRTGVSRAGPVPANATRDYSFLRVYVSPFSDRQVKRYIRKVFRPWQSERKRAWALVCAVPDLVARPMLLQHLPTLLEAKRPFGGMLDVYEAIVRAWLAREDSPRLVPNTALLRDFCEQLAVDLYENRARRGGERIHFTELAPLAAAFRVAMADYQVRARSLLNRDAGGNYKFAHRSIMEYLAVCRYRAGSAGAGFAACGWTHLMKSFLIEMIRKSWRDQGTVPFELGPLSPAEIRRIGLEPRMRLRAEGRTICEDDVTKMIRDHGFYDPQVNPRGHSPAVLHRLPCYPEAVVDLASGLTWEKTGSRERFAASEAQRHIDRLNGRAVAGRRDWRFPTMEEALSLQRPRRDWEEYDVGPTSAPHIDGKFSDEAFVIWSADAAEDDRRWCVSYLNASRNAVPRASADCFVRAVAG
jgi:hypothetical protein